MLLLKYYLTLSDNYGLARVGKGIRHLSSTYASDDWWHSLTMGMSACVEHLELYNLNAGQSLQ